MVTPRIYSRKIIDYKDPGRYIPYIFLLYSWGPPFGVPSKVPLYLGVRRLSKYTYILYNPHSICHGLNFPRGLGSYSSRSRVEQVSLI